ncbi:MAG: hypothetical protein Q7J24_05495 [Desulfomicrobium sp.]|nr:hypothetical protein [Desulfomicrobium sp.]
MSGLYLFSLAFAMVVLDFKNLNCCHVAKIQAAELIVGRRLVVRPENEALRVMQVGSEFAVPVSVKGVASGVDLLENCERGSGPHLLQPKIDLRSHGRAEFLSQHFVIIENFFFPRVSEKYVHTRFLVDFFNQHG